MQEIAVAVGVAPSALYHHFGSKEDLLRESVEHALRGLELAVARSASLDELLTRLASANFEREVTAALWQRDSRHLAPSDRTALHMRGLALKDRCAAAIAQHHPGIGAAEAALRAWAVLSVLGSSSQQDFAEDVALTSQTLLDCARSICEPRKLQPDAAQAEPAPSLRPPRKLLPLSRREALLQIAIDLFSTKGYHSVNLAEIAAKAGIAAPSIYNHVESKADLLATGLRRCHEALMLDLQQALGRSATAADALAHLIDAYVAIALKHTALMDVRTTQVIYLAQDERDAIRSSNRLYLNEWVSLVRGARPAWSEAEARIRAAAAQTLITELARTASLRSIAGFSGKLQRLASLLVLTDN